jgi:uncharacterized membrane protein
MIQDIVIIYILLLVFDLPMILTNKMYKDLFSNINNNQTKTLSLSVYLSMFLIYLLLAIGIFYFVIKDSKNINDAIMKAILFGIIVYGVYDLTNYCTIINYTLKVTILDIIWGSVLSTLVTYSYLKLTKRF